jgi:hypothetical protein
VKSAAAVLLLTLAVCAAVFTFQVVSTLRELPLLVDNAIAREGAETRRVALEAVAGVRNSLAGEIRATRGTLDHRLDDAIAKLDTRLGTITDAASDELRTTGAELRRTGTAARIAIDRYAAIPGVVGERLDPWTDCRGNGACWQAQATAALGGLRATLGESARTARTIREVSPQIAVSLQRSADATAKSTEQTSLLIADARTYFRPLPKPLQSAKVQVPAWIASKFWMYFVPFLF